MRRPLRGPYDALASRADRRLISEGFSWSIRDPLPTIPVPLMAPDLDSSMELSAVFAALDRRGQYERSIDDPAPLDLPLGARDRDWAQKRAGGHGGSKSRRR